MTPLPRRVSLAALAALALAAAFLPTSPPDARGGTRPAKPDRAALGTGPMVRRSRPVLGGTLLVAGASRATVTDSAPAERAVAAALDAASRLEPALGDQGELARLNGAAAGAPFACSPDLYAALDSALAVAAATSGAWDPTSEPVRAAWRDSPDGRAPAPESLSDARAVTGWRMLQLEPGRRTARFTRPGMAVTLDAVRPGLALERAAEALRGLGVVRARLELGPVTLTFTSREPWTLRVACPPDAEGPALRLALSDAACATAALPGPASGPVVDPRTARVPPGQATVAVVARSACRAGALAEALLVMGRDEAAAYASAHPDLGVLWLEPAGADLRAWAWNLGAVETEPGLRVEWMTLR